MRTGLDDGPELPSAKAIEAACRRIDAAAPRTDAERINWLEKNKYLETGIGYYENRPAIAIRFREHGNLRQFSGRSLRAAIDAAMDAEK